MFSVQARGRGGLLLVEAVLSAVVIAVGLVAISRGLANQLKALRTLEEHETLRSLAIHWLRETEGMLSHDPAQVIPWAQDLEAMFEPPHEQYRWALAVVPSEESPESPSSVAHRELHLSVQRDDRPSSRVELVVLWPDNWLPQAWR
jgi:hypothetical protein